MVDVEFNSKRITNTSFHRRGTYTCSTPRVSIDSPIFNAFDPKRAVGRTGSRDRERPETQPIEVDWD
jgi:hypothetical protein